MRAATLAAAAVSLLLAPAWSAASSAAGAPQRPPRVVLAQAPASVSAAEAAAMVGARTGGRVLDVRSEQGGGRLVYRVKVLLEGGRVRIYRVDAESGRMSE